MPTLYVENVPDEVYAALRLQAKQKRSSIASEVVALLTERFPTAEEKQRRRAFYERALQQAQAAPKAMAVGANAAYFPSTEQMQREDRER
jgi:plasmid stability protein